ncbi:unnamed protein product [Phyllotreta striolata]|uniref:Aminopeptidase N n=1 Tax=Phyllotreta striolata TaxID=444603 RepID=A0A9N9XRP7_PHYSR|nr:unnamed protein product [Phyllotreta striolata]
MRDKNFPLKKIPNDAETGVPTTVDLENNSSQKKYTVNQSNNKGLVISKPLCLLMGIGALLLAILVGLVVFFLVPQYCNGEKPPEALTHVQTSSDNVKVESKADDDDDDIDERLPRSIEPRHYEIKILPDLRNFTTEGSITMTLQVLQTTDEIQFHLQGIEISQESVRITSTGDTPDNIEITNQEYLPGDKYRIKLNQNLASDGIYELYAEYTGRLGEHLQGFYGIHYNDANGRERTMASTQFSPVEARKAFPCFDEPSFKSTFKIILARPSDMSTLSNMPLLTSTPIEQPTNKSKKSIATNDGWYWDEYQTTPKMSTYLVAFMVHDLKPYETPEGPMKFWSRDQLVPFAAYAARIGPKILRYFEGYFNSKFPLEKIDVVAVPSFGFSAMENWGLITFRESSLLYDSNSSTVEDISNIAKVFAHELAHQWFGNLVTPRYWNDLWLKEGFANYMAFLGVNEVEPSWKFPEEFVLTYTEAALQNDALESSRPLSFDEAKNSRQIRELFDGISYSKGAAIVRMMNHFLGESTFRQGLVNYLKKYQYSNADRSDLFASFTEEAHKNEVLQPDENVETIMETWTKTAGLPVINVQPDYDRGVLQLTQKRFYYSGKADEDTAWWVPISFATNASGAPDFNDTSPKFWMRGERAIAVEVNVTRHDWYLLNLEQTGYFIVNYDADNWRKLAGDIMKMPPLVRAQLISDSMDLARAGLLVYDVPLMMIANMAIQDDNIMYIPTKVTFAKLKYLSDILSDTPAFGLFEHYHKNIFQETYKRVTLDDRVHEHLTRKIRMTVLEWSCRSPDSRCTHLAKTSFRNWIVRGKNVESNLRSIVYCTAIREGGEIEWDFAYKKYLESTSASEKDAILDALGCTSLKWLLSRYLDKLLSDRSITIQDADRLFNSVVENKVGTQIAFDFLRKNWNAIIKHHGNGFNIVSKMILKLGDHLSTEFQLSELIRFRDGTKDKLTTGSFAIAIDKVKANVEWMRKNYQPVKEWLENNRDLRSTVIERLKYESYLQSQGAARGA